MSVLEEVTAALRGYDADLRVLPPGVVVADGREFYSNSWRVYRYVGSERPIQFVCGWWNQWGEPYPGEPSTEALLNMVKALDMNTRFERESADARNERLVAERKKDADRDFEEIGKEFDKAISGKSKSVLFRGKNLQAARNRVRARTKDKDLRP